MELHNFSSLVNQLFGTLLAFDMRTCTARPRNSVRDISAEGAFEFLRGVLAAALYFSATSRSRVT
ncbi:MAG: hypothetical protein DMF27_03875 [Verrucomicrobia bacterium]|nr:MAG: hypothetical protein DMF27_03875 [Verrucomicrobiota bacterium]